MLAADAVGVVAGTLGGHTEHVLAGRDIDIVHDLGEDILLFLLGRVRLEERQLALVTVHDIEDNHAGSGKARSAQVLLNPPRAMPLSGYELVRPELTCKESALLCFH